MRKDILFRNVLFSVQGDGEFQYRFCCYLLKRRDRTAFLNFHLRGPYAFG